ncbi:hypothetical protein LCGC14_2932500, partial [marine sediment metagenome]
MSQHMYICPKCENRVRTLYEWKGEEFCGMCQQENIEWYEVTLIYRFFLLFRLTKDYMGYVLDQVFFPSRGWIRRFIKFIVCETQGVIVYVQRYFQRARERRNEKKARAADRKQREAEKERAKKWPN